VGVLAMTFPFGETITVITRTKTGVDGYGNATYGESSVDVIGAFDPAIGFESTAGNHDQVTSQPQALLPFDAVVDSNTVLVIRGKRFEVDGEPNYWQSPFSGWQAGLAVPLKRQTG
jgi:hypothetical protein